MDTDPTLLSDPVFSHRHDMGLDPEGASVRNNNDPAIRALKVVGAERVPHGDIYMCTWDESADAPDVLFPLADGENQFHTYELPPRRAANGPNIHS